MSRSSADGRSMWSYVKPKSALQWVLGPLILLAVLGWFVGIPIVAAGTSPNATWSGGTLLLTAPKHEGGECSIRPDQGAERTVSVEETSGNSTQTLAEQVQPWFAGSAEVSCEEDVDIRTGWRASLTALSMSFGGLMGFAVCVGVLALVYLFAGGGARSSGAQRTDVRNEEKQ